MQDVFYYSQAKVTLGDIQRLAEGLGYRCTLVPWGEGCINLTISFGGKINVLRGFEHEWVEDHWYVDEVTASEWEDAAEWEEEDVYVVVNSYQPRSMFTIGYHQEHLPELASFLHLLLVQYGGQVMVDAESVYSEGNVRNIVRHIR